MTSLTLLAVSLLFCFLTALSGGMVILLCLGGDRPIDAARVSPLLGHATINCLGDVVSIQHCAMVLRMTKGAVVDVGLLSRSVSYRHNDTTQNNRAFHRRFSCGMIVNLWRFVLTVPHFSNRTTHRCFSILSCVASHIYQTESWL